MRKLIFSIFLILSISTSVFGQVSLRPPYSDTRSIVAGSADNTKQIRFEVDGITTGTVRVLTVPNASLTIVGTDTTQDLSNKTLTAPKFVDLGFIADSSGNELLGFDSAATAINYPVVYNSPAGEAVGIYVLGDDPNVSLELGAKGNSPIISGSPLRFDSSSHFGTEVTTVATVGETSVNLTDKNLQTFSLASASGAVSVDFNPAPPGGAQGTIVILQHATPKDITAWELVDDNGANVVWQGTEPDWLTLAASSRTILSWRYDGTRIYLGAPSSVSVSGDGQFIQTTTSDSITDGEIVQADGNGNIEGSTIFSADVARLSGTQSFTGTKRFTTGLRIDGDQKIYDENGAAVIGIESATTPVSHVVVFSAGAGDGPGLYPGGAATDIELEFWGKGAFGVASMMDHRFQESANFGVVNAPTVATNAVTINLSASNHFFVDLEPATATVTCTINPGVGTQSGSIYFKQDGGGQPAITFVDGTGVGQIVWMGTAIDFTTIAVDKVVAISYTFVDDATNDVYFHGSTVEGTRIGTP